MDVFTRPLRPESFAAFGTVLAAPSQGQRDDNAAVLFNGRTSAALNLATVNAPMVRLPLTIEQLERHEHSTQSFIPLDADEYLVVVCPDDGMGQPALDELAAFVAERGQGFTYNANIWHHPMSALGRPASFALLIWEDGTAADCEVMHMTEMVTVGRG